MPSLKPNVLLLLSLAAASLHLAAMDIRITRIAPSPGFKEAYVLEVFGHGFDPATVTWRLRVAPAETGAWVDVLAADVNRWVHRDVHGRWVLEIPQGLAGRLSLQALASGGAASEPKLFYVSAGAAAPVRAPAAPEPSPEGGATFTRFAELPDTLKARVLAFVPGTGASLDRASLQAERDTTGSVKVEGLLSATALRDYLRLHRRITRLRIGNLPTLHPDDLTAALEGLHRLQALEVDGACGAFEARHLLQLAVANPRLADLTVPRSVLTREAVEARKDSLTHLRIQLAPLGFEETDATRARFRQACAALRGCTRLQDLSAREAEGLEDGHLPPGLHRLWLERNATLAGQALPADLEDVTLRFCTGIAGPLARPDRPLARLRRLDLFCCGPCTQEDLGVTVRSSPALADLSTSFQLTADGLRALQGGALTHLALVTSHELEQTDFSGFAGLTHLTLGTVGAAPLVLPASLVRLELQDARYGYRGAGLPATLAELSVNYAGDAFPEAALPRGLVTLECFGSSAWTGAGLPAGLRRLKLAHCRMIRDLQHLKVLEDLDARECNHLFDGGFEPGASLGESLCSLTLEDCDGAATPEEALAIAAKLPGLRILDFNTNHPMGYLPERVRKAIQAHPNLASVTLRVPAANTSKRPVTLVREPEAPAPAASGAAAPAASGAAAPAASGAAAPGPSASSSSSSSATQDHAAPRALLTASSAHLYPGTSVTLRFAPVLPGQQVLWGKPEGGGDGDYLVDNRDGTATYIASLDTREGRKVRISARLASLSGGAPAPSVEVVLEER